MKKLTTRILSILLAVIMFGGMMPICIIPASAASYDPIELKVPWYTTKYKDGCGITAVTMLQAYFKGYGENEKGIQEYIYKYNNKSVRLSSYSYLGLIWESKYPKSLEGIYKYLKQGDPVILYMKQSKGKSTHFIVIYGYNGSTTKLEKKGFKVMSPNTSKKSTKYFGYTNLANANEMWDRIGHYEYVSL